MALFNPACVGLRSAKQHGGREFNGEKKRRNGGSKKSQRRACIDGASRVTWDQSSVGRLGVGRPGGDRGDLHGMPSRLYTIPGIGLQQPLIFIINTSYRVEIVTFGPSG